MLRSPAIQFDFPEIPVSINELYDINSSGRKTLTKPGREYRNRFITSCGGVPVVELLQFEADKNQTYLAILWFLLPASRLFSESRKAKCKIKKIDVDNLAKLALDCIAAVLDLDDRNNFTVILNKRPAPSLGPRTVAKIQPLDLEFDPFPIPGSTSDLTRENERRLISGWSAQI